LVGAAVVGFCEGAFVVGANVVTGFLVGTAVVSLTVGVCVGFLVGNAVVGLVVITGNVGLVDGA
jgi:hypothetical protein